MVGLPPPPNPTPPPSVINQVTPMIEWVNFLCLFRSDFQNEMFYLFPIHVTYYTFRPSCPL
jgi:hypothetical protein